MGIRCSLLGHDYGEPETEREREERGNEVITTVREVKECARCGVTSVVTENTEVTAIESEPDEPPASAPEPPGSDDGFEYDNDVEEPVEADIEDDAVILDDEPSEPAHASADAPADANDEAAEGATDASPDWPAAEADGADDEAAEDAAESPPSQPWPEHESEDEGYDAGLPDGERADVEFGGGLTPEGTGGPDDGTDVEYVSAETAGVAGFTSAGPLEDDPDVDSVDVDFVCPECGFERPALGSSLRAGDICPECRRGYLAENER